MLKLGPKPVSRAFSKGRGFDNTHGIGSVLCEGPRLKFWSTTVDKITSIFLCNCCWRCSRDSIGAHEAIACTQSRDSDAKAPI